MQTDRSGHDRIKRLGVCVVLVFAVLFVWLRLTAVDGLDRFGNPLLPDFGQFYVAGHLAGSGQIARLYDEPFFFAQVNALFGVTKEADGYPFLYPPFVAWACVPLSWLPYSVAATLYLCGSIALAVGLGWSVANRLLSDKAEARDAVWLLVAAIPTIRCVLYGQNGLVSLLILWLGYVFWKQGRSGWAGAVWALGWYKPQVFVGVWAGLFLFGNWKARGGWLAGALVLLGAGWFGGAGNGALWADWLEAARCVHDSPLTRTQMHSVLNAFDLWTPLPEWLRLLRGGFWMAMALSWIGGLWMLGKVRRNGAWPEPRWEGLAWAWVLLGGALLSPRLIQYDLVILYPVIVGWWALARKGEPSKRRKQGMALAGLILAFYLTDLFSRNGVPIITMLGVALYIQLCIEMRQSYCAYK